jgi:hypothetical protein
MEEAQHELAREIWEHFNTQDGWRCHQKSRYANGFIDHWGERYIDLSGDSGFTWQLNLTIPIATASQRRAGSSRPKAIRSPNFWRS